MKKMLLMLVTVFTAQFSFAQLNMELLSQVQYNQPINDVWGWVDEETNIEYAIVGLQNGVSIVSLEDPEAAVEVVSIPGQNSTWRDIKTHGDWAYVVTDQNGSTEGVTVIDLSDLPNSAPAYHWTPDIPGLGTLYECHNIYIDEEGFAYLAGCNLNNGGMLFIDVFTTPGVPQFVAPAVGIYAHDVYVRDNKMYSSEIYLGRMAIYDVADKQDVSLLGAQMTPFEFTHNIWLSDDSQVAYTTDERDNAPVGAYNITDLEEIIELDQFRPIETLSTNVVPHNVHVWEDWLIISYYTDGGIIADASRPGNLIEVGNFDTFFGSGGGTNGAWGAYPFLPSQNVLITDRSNGLFVCGVTYVRACWLEGTVTDAVTNAPLNNVFVEIDTDEANQDFSSLDGKYATGLATSGEYDVTFVKEGYEQLTTTATLDNGVVTTLDVQLQPLQQHTVAGTTIEEIGGALIPGTKVILMNDLSFFETEADMSGTFSLDGIFEETYNVYVGQWGYQEKVIEDITIDGTNDLTLTLATGYRDAFYADYGWETSAGPGIEDGFWVREEPNGTFRANGDAANPDFDIFGDLGDQCWVTGNAPGNSTSDDVDDDKVYLDSPPMDLTTYAEPVVSYYLWFYNAAGGSTPDDSLIVSINNGIETVVLEIVTESGSDWRAQSEISLLGLIDLTDNMTIRFETGDFDPTGHIVEAAVDVFAVTDAAVINNNTDLLADVKWAIAPNPFTEAAEITFDLPEHFGNLELNLLNVSGQLLRTYPVAHGQATIKVGEGLAAGFYIAQLSSNGTIVQSKKIVKQ